MLTKLRKIGNSVGLTIPQRILDLAGFAEGQQVALTAKAGSITITSDLQVEVGLTLDEAKAIAAGEQDSPEAIKAREKICAQIEKTRIDKL
jgi:antitoxin component of MazEF toxin-antitoxin module